MSSEWRKWAGNHHPAWGRPGHQAGLGGKVGRPAVGTNFWNSGVSRRHSLHPGTGTTQLAGGTASQLFSTLMALLQTKCPILFLTTHLGLPVPHPPPSIHQVSEPFQLFSLNGVPASPAPISFLQGPAQCDLFREAAPILMAGSESGLLLAPSALGAQTVSITHSLNTH